MRPTTVEYEISGRNFALLLHKINLKRIPFFDLYKTPSGYRVKVEKNYCAEFESLLKQSWQYKVVAKRGKEALFLRLIKALGVVIGIIIFTIGCYFSGDLLIKIKYSGDYSYFYRDIERVLDRNSVKKYSRFSQIDCNLLSEQIYAENPLICYSLVKKEGNFLIVEVKKSQDYTYGVDTTVKQLKSTVDGQILELKVYRGTALKKVGDEVKKGEVIVSGERVEEDKTYQSFVLASAKILKSYEYREKGEDTSQNRARALSRAKVLCGAEDYYFEQISCENGEILVKLKYIVILGG